MNLQESTRSLRFTKNAQTPRSIHQRRKIGLVLRSLPGYLPFHQSHCMFIGKAGNVQAKSYHLYDRMVVFVHETSNIDGPLFRVTLHRFIPMPHVLW